MVSNSSKRDGGRLHIRLPPELKRKLERYAKKHNMTVTVVAIKAFETVLNMDIVFKPWNSEK